METNEVPPCRLCGKPPELENVEDVQGCWCLTERCGMEGFWLTLDDWRRVMGGPKP